VRPEHVARAKRRIKRGLNGNPARSKGSNTKAALRSERAALFSIGKGRVKHHEYCMTCMLDCEVLRAVDNSYAASLHRTGGGDLQKARENAVMKDIVERGDNARYNFDTCPKIAMRRGVEEERVRIT